MILWKRLFHNICIDKMKALFPIKKEYVKKIFDGSKAYEYRKSFCSLEVDTIVIYESRGKGLVVGEFEIADRLCDTPRNIWERTKGYAGISESDFFSYFEGRDKAINNNLERFPSDFLITLTDSEKQEVVTKCDHLQNLKYSRNSPHAFTEAGIFMLATLIDSNEARNVAFKIIETFTEHQQLLRHIMVAEYKDEYGKKKEEAYMEDKLKHILARSSACI